MDRRIFLKGAIMAGIASSMKGAEDPKPATKGMLYRTLGRTGESVSAIGLGGFHLGNPKLSEEESIRLIRAAIDGGITFMDNSWDYNEGQSEIRMG
jgi:hypothetical protein